MVAPLAVHGIFTRTKLTEPLDPRALHAAQLLGGSSLGSVFAKAHRIHFSHDFQPRALVEGEARLKEQPVESCAAGLPRGVEADTRLADPCDQRSGARRQGDRRVANASTGLQHEAGDVADWNVRAHAAVVHDDQNAVEHVESPLLDEQDRRMFLGRYKLRRRKPAQHPAPWPLTWSSELA